MSNSTPAQQGFTLLELMITVAIAAILLAIAIPSFESTIARSQLTTKTNDFLAGLASARTEAIKNNTRVVMCASANGTTCTGAPWTGGWLVFIDTDRDGALDAGETITKVSQVTSDLSVVGTATVNGAAATPIAFSPDGTLFRNAGGTVRVCKATTALPANENARDIVINGVGTPRVQRPNPAIAVGTCPTPP